MRKLLVLLPVALMLLSCSSNQFKITGKIEGAEDQMLYLKTMKDGELIIVDSTMLTKAAFNFKGSVEVADLYAIDFKQTEDRIILFLDNSKINITGKAENVMDSEIKGSASHDVFVKYNKQQEELAKPLMEIQQKYQEAAMQGTLTPEMDQEMKNQYMKETEKLVDAVKVFVNENSTSVVSAYIVLTQLANSLKVEELEEIVSKFPSDIQTSPFVVALNEKVDLEKKTAIGQSFMDFTHPDADGNLITFSSVTGTNYILLDFWAGWCTPCRRENPNLVKLYNQYNKKGFEIFGVSLDRSREEWLEAIKADKLTWTHVSDITFWENPIAKMYGIQSIPANLLISPEGKIIGKNLKGEELAAKLAEIFN